MKQFAQTYYLLQFIICLICLSISCGEGGNDNYSETNDERNKEPEITVSPITNLEAKSTQIANQLLITWQNPNTPNLLGVELSYLQKNGGTHNGKQIIQGAAGKTGNYTLQLPQYGTYEISAIAIDNYGHRSSAVTVIATPAETTVPFSWATLADSCTYVLIEQFMNKSKGTFWSTPKDMSDESTYIYWQQAHAMDVVIYSYKRIKDTNKQLAATYRTYFERWYANHANNYHRNPSDETGFLNDFTDDMCWICLTLIHLSEATGDEKFAQTAKIVYDKYIITRAWTDDKGTGLPWNTTQNDRNACTNSPGCLVAAKLYQRYEDGNYLSDAKKLYEYIDHFLVGDFEMAAGLFEMELDMDPEDHLEATKPLAYCYVALGEYESFDEIVDDISDKYPEKEILKLWSEFRRTGRLPSGEMIHFRKSFPVFYAEFTSDKHEITPDYLADIESERPSREAQARELWLQTEHLWTQFPGFVEALKKQ